MNCATLYQIQYTHRAEAQSHRIMLFCINITHMARNHVHLIKPKEHTYHAKRTPIGRNVKPLHFVALSECRMTAPSSDMTPHLI